MMFKSDLSGICLGDESVQLENLMEILNLNTEHKLLKKKLKALSLWTSNWVCSWIRYYCYVVQSSYALV